MHEIKVKVAKRDGIKCIVCTDLSARHGNRECQRTDVDSSSVCGQAMGRRDHAIELEPDRSSGAESWAGLGWAGLGWAVPAGDRQQHITIIT